MVHLLGKTMKLLLFLSFLNIEGRVASCNDNFLIFGANCGEEHEAAKRYCSRLMDNIVNIEANSFSIA